MKYKKTVLKNNLRIISHEMPKRDSMSIGIWVGAGGRFEDEKNKGAAHFLEHILFKGTKHYSCDEIKKQIEGVGGSLNAFTDEETTCYFAKIPAKHLPKTFDVLADMVLHPLITKTDVDKERTVILEEIKMYHDLPQHFVIELLDGLMWPQHPLGMNLAGSFESVGKMTEQDLREFHGEFYVADKIVVSGCGRFHHQALVELVKEKFKDIKKDSSPEFLEAVNAQDKSQVKFHRKDIEQMHLALGAFGLEIDHVDKHAFHLLHVILGANMSSRLFDEVREKRGLAYAISSSIKSLKDTGLFMVRAGVDNKKITDAVRVILEELYKVKREEITKNEFTRAKDYYSGQVLLGLEDTLDHMFWIGDGIVTLDRVKTLRQILQEVKKVTIEDVQRVAQRIFEKNNINLAIVGPLKEQQEKELSRILSSHQ